MATIVFTSLSSVRAHHGHGAVDWRDGARDGARHVAGALGAALVAGLDADAPAGDAFHRLWSLSSARRCSSSSSPSPRASCRALRACFGAGAVIGGVSSLLRPRAARFSPFRSSPGATCRSRHRHRVGQRLSDRAAGTVGYVAGWRVPGLPAGSLGYVYLPALGLVVAASMPLAPFGARLAHRLPVRRLRVIFAR